MPHQARRGPARRAFGRFVVDGVYAEDPFDQMPRSGILGSESLIETVLKKFDTGKISAENPKKLLPTAPGRSCLKQDPTPRTREEWVSGTVRRSVFARIYSC